MTSQGTRRQRAAEARAAGSHVHGESGQGYRRHTALLLVPLLPGERSLFRRAYLHAYVVEVACAMASLPSPNMRVKPSPSCAVEGQAMYVCALFVVVHVRTMLWILSFLVVGSGSLFVCSLCWRLVVCRALSKLFPLYRLCRVGRLRPVGYWEGVPNSKFAVE